MTMRFELLAILSMTTYPLAAPALRAQATDTTRNAPPVRPVPTSVPLRPQSDSAKSRPQPTSGSTAQAREPASYSRIFIGAVAGGVVGGVLAYAIAARRTPDCALCQLDGADDAFRGALAGALLGGTIGALTGRGR